MTNGLDIEGIYLRNVQRVYRLCYSFLRSASDAEDATQSIFEKLLTLEKPFRDAEHEKAWLIVTTQNFCRDVLKSAYRKKVSFADDDQVFEKEDDEFEQSDVMRAILDLPDTYKTCVYLFYYEGYTSSEIAPMLGVSPSTVRNYLSEARVLLKGMLGDGTETNE